MLRLLSFSRIQPQESWRNALFVAAAALVVWIVIAQWLWGPRIQRQLVIVAGNPNGAYVRDAQRYVSELSHHGVVASIAYTTGWTGIMDRFNDPGSASDLGFAQGMYAHRAPSNLLGLAAISREPLWMYARANDVLPTGELASWRDKRVDAGPSRTSTYQSVMALLAAQSSASARSVSEETGDNALKRLMNKDTDVMAMITGDSTQAVQIANRSNELRLLRADTVEVVRAAEPRLRPFLLNRGALSDSRTVPAHDMLMLATETHLIARDTVTPELQRLLAKLAKQIHGEASALRAAQEFPRFADLDFRASPHVGATGEPPWLESSLPYGVATWVRWLLTFIGPALLLLGFGLWIVRSTLGLREHDTLRRIDWRLDDIERHLAKPSALPLTQLRQALRDLQSQDHKTQRVSQSAALLQERIGRTQQRLARLRDHVQSTIQERIGLTSGEHAWAGD
jgi:hypothetical protein